MNAITVKMCEALHNGKSDDQAVELKLYNSRACSLSNKGRWKSNQMWFFNGKRVSFAKCCELTK